MGSFDVLACKSVTGLPLLSTFGDELLPLSPESPPIVYDSLETLRWKAT